MGRFNGVFKKSPSSVEKAVLASQLNPIRRIRISEADNLIVEGNYYFFGERGNFKATLKENKRELQILDLELMPKQ